jgi:predicted PurR-regulated permease PerM
MPRKADIKRSEFQPRHGRFPPALTLLAVGALLYFAREVLIPIALALLLAFLLAPLVRRLERWRIPRVLAVGAAVGVTAMGVGAVGWLVQGQVMLLAAQLPGYKENIRHKLDWLRPRGGSVIEKASDTLAELGREITKPAAGENTPGGPGGAEDGGKVASADRLRSVPNAAATAGAAGAAKGAEPVPVSVVAEPTPPLTYAKSILGPILSRAATTSIVVVFAVFMLMKREDLRNRLLWLIGERAMHLSTPAFDDAAQRVSSYLLMQLVVNGIAGTAVGIGLYFLGVPSALVWGLMLGLLRFIPYVGAVIGGVLPFALSLATSPDWWQPAMVAGLILAVEVIAGNVLEPWLYGAKTGLSPLAILAAAVFWTWLWGPVGLLLSTPLTVCLAVIGRHVPNLSYLEALLGDEPVLSPAATFYQRLLAGDHEEAGQIVEGFAKDKDKDMTGVYDELFVPALRMSEMDRHRGAIGADQQRAILDMLWMMIEDAAEGTAPGVEPATVLCLPARDRSDEIVARMLAQLLGAAGVSTRAMSMDSLLSEMLEEVGRAAPAVVCISAVPPAAALQSRVLAKRLHARFPAQRLVVGAWDSAADPQLMQLQLGDPGLLFVVTTLRQAVAQTRSLAATASVPPSRAPEIVTDVRVAPGSLRPAV